MLEGVLNRKVSHGCLMQAKSGAKHSRKQSLAKHTTWSHFVEIFCDIINSKNSQSNRV